MGTSGAWGGSSGSDWKKLRDDVVDALDNPSTENAEAIVDDLIGALDWADDATPSPVQPSAPVPAPGPPVAVPRLGAGTGGGGAGGGSGGIFLRKSSGGASGGGGTGGSRRSRAAAASVAGRVISAGLALRAGDATALGRLGLDLAELRTLRPFKQIQKILSVLVGNGAGLEETELLKANAPALRAIIVDQLTGLDAVRAFVVAYVMEVFSSESGEASRDGSRNGADSLKVENEVRSVVNARVRQIDFEGNAVSGEELSRAVETTLKLMRKVRPA